MLVLPCASTTVPVSVAEPKCSVWLVLNATVPPDTVSVLPAVAPTVDWALKVMPVTVVEAVASSVELLLRVTAPVPMAVALPATTLSPAVIVVPPEKVLLPESVSTLVLFWTIEPPPVMALLTVWLVDWLKVTLPLWMPMLPVRLEPF